MLSHDFFSVVITGLDILPDSGLTDWIKFIGISSNGEQ